MSPHGSASLSPLSRLKPGRHGFGRVTQLVCSGRHAQPRHRPSIADGAFINSTTRSTSCPITLILTIYRCLPRPATQQRNSASPSVTPAAKVYSNHHAMPPIGTLARPTKATCRRNGNWRVAWKTVEGLTQSREDATNWYHRAAEQGLAFAQSGLCVTQDCCSTSRNAALELSRG